MGVTSGDTGVIYYLLDETSEKEAALTATI